MPEMVRTLNDPNVSATRRSKTDWLIRSWIGIMPSITPVTRPSRSTSGANRTTGHTPREWAVKPRTLVPSLPPMLNSVTPVPSMNQPLTASSADAGTASTWSAHSGRLSDAGSA